MLTSITITLLLLVGVSDRRHHHNVHVAHGFSFSSSSSPSPPPPYWSSRHPYPLKTTHRHYPSCSSFLQKQWQRCIFAFSGTRRSGGILASSSSSSPAESNSDTNENNYNLNFMTEKEIIDKSMDYLANCIRHHLDSTKKSPSATTIATATAETIAQDIVPFNVVGNSNSASTRYDENRQNHDWNAHEEGCSGTPSNRKIIPFNLAKGRFVDLATSLRGEQLLENLFLHSFHDHDDDNAIINSINNNVHDDRSHLQDVRIVQYAIVALQSLLIYGMQVGVVGSDESQAKMVRHLFRPGDDITSNKGGKEDDVFWEKYAPRWDAECIRLLKYRRNISPGKLVLKTLKRKRTARGAFDLLVDMGVWTKHEDVALLRSGFPVRFTETEIQVAKEVAAKANKNGGGGGDVDDDDPDAALGLRKDLRHFKVYTIDGPSTFDIDDGISVEVLSDDDGNHSDRVSTVRDRNEEQRSDCRLRYWIHIADVDRWAPRGSELLRVAERRGTSLYLPHMTLNVFPEIMSSGIMSLEAWQDKCALSLGVELNADGTIIPSSIILTPSKVHVHYRLTYDQVDEMLDEGVGYTEEWEIGALLSAATVRRAHRVSRGSTEAMVPCPIPKGVVAATYDEPMDDFNISLKIEATHNSGVNVTTIAGTTKVVDAHNDLYVSSSQLIVTEMMILAGEAIGKWQVMQSENEEIRTDDDKCIQLPNRLELPFRRQPAPDFKSREIEARHLDFLLEMNQLYPHAWYARRFFNKVIVSEEIGPHFGMGLDCYVQWSSPIRRLTDLQVHSALKRYLRRKRVNELLREGLPIPSDISSMDLGYDISTIKQSPSSLTAIDPIDYTSGLGMIFAGRPIQSSSSTYWLFEYIRRLIDQSHQEVMFESIVLGCVNKERFQYAIYVYELGLEHRYLSETGKLDEGQKLWLKVTSVNPRMELLTFSLASRSGGIHAQRTAAAAA